MTGLGRPLVLAAALNAAVGVGAAAAQTVIATNVPPGSTVELVLNAASMGTATADRVGNATLTVNLFTTAAKTQVDVRIYVDTCGSNLRKVVLVESTQLPPAPGDTCDRREITGLYVVRRVTTLVVSLSAANPMAWLRQGSVPAAWLSPQAEGAATETPARPSPTGFVVFGGAGLTTFRDVVGLSCGDVEGCSGSNGVSFGAGAAYWFTRFLAAEARYIRPAKITVEGSGNGFSFDTFLDTDVLTVAANVGVPLGPVRPYGKVGANYHRALYSTTQTLDSATITIDDVSVTIPGGTETIGLRTGGWGWLFGGGLEGWITPRLALYGEFAYAHLKGTNLDVGEGGLDEGVSFLQFGVRIHLGRTR